MEAHVITQHLVVFNEDPNYPYKKLITIYYSVKFHLR